MNYYSTACVHSIKQRIKLVGWDIICRAGDPTNVHDLVRAGAQNATSIVMMLADKDQAEHSASRGLVNNGGTICGVSEPPALEGSNGMTRVCVCVMNDLGANLSQSIH